MMLKVMIVDDEPFIVQGLCVLIDWQEEGYEIVKTATNGQEAYDYLLTNQVDLIMTDIKMPIMSGLELLQRVRSEKLSAAHFIVFSGYKDFEYVRSAMRYECIDYVLKPVQREELLRNLRQITRKEEVRLIENETSLQMQKAYLQHSLISLICGKFEKENLEFVLEQLPVLAVSKEIRYIHIHPSNIVLVEEMDDEELASHRKKMSTKCCDFLKEEASLCIRDIPGFEDEYDIGLIYCDAMAHKRGWDTEEFLKQLLHHMCLDAKIQVIILAGRSVDDISRLCHSFEEAGRLRSFQRFQEPKDIYFYEEEMQNNSSDGVVLCNESLDLLLYAVENNDKMEIRNAVDYLFAEMEQRQFGEKRMTMNINYLLYRLIHLAVEQDRGVNQEEVLHYIGENSFENGIVRGSRMHLRRFACEYADYLVQLRKNVSRGIFEEIEREVEQHFCENLTLRDLGQKYYVNSSYLGQIFRKKYGQSFKDYLCAYRIDRAASELLHTDHKINMIAEEVGYKDVDYFIRKFIAQKGCTPAKFRKQANE